MKEIIIKVDDELYDRANESVADLESSVNEQVTSYLKALNSDGLRITTARSRMKELFNITRGFGVGQKPSREEMHGGRIA
jgi:DNA replication initiation complex subunit (GINS family)